MKNQNDLIVAGAVVLVCIGVSLAFMFTKREPVKPPAPPVVVTKDAEPSAASVVYANSLPGEGSGGPGAQAGGASAMATPSGAMATGVVGGGGGGTSATAK